MLDQIFVGEHNGRARYRIVRATHFLFRGLIDEISLGVHSVGPGADGHADDGMSARGVPRGATVRATANRFGSVRLGGFRTEIGSVIGSVRFGGKSSIMSRNLGLFTLKLRIL